MCAKELKYGALLPNDYLFIKRVQEMGITPKYMGFYYIIEILDLLINESVLVRSFSKQVYPMLAKKYNKKECTIERNIRSVIDKLWQNKLKEKLMFLWLRETQPTCCEFIYILKNYIMTEFT